MTDKSSGFSCKRCADILRRGSQQDCDGCCRKLHPTCSGLPGDVYYQLRKSKKARWACDLCSAWVAKKDEDKQVVKQISCFVKSVGTAGSLLSKKSKSTADLDLIESVSNTFGNILSQLTEMKEINKSIDDRIRKLSESRNIFVHSIGEETERNDQEKNITVIDNFSDMTSRKKVLNNCIERFEDVNNIPQKCPWQDKAMEVEDDFDDVFEKDSTDDTNIDWWRRSNHRLSLKQSSVEFDFGLKLPFQSDGTVRNFISVASVSTAGSINDQDYPKEEEATKRDVTGHSKSSFSGENTVHSRVDTIYDTDISKYLKHDTEYNNTKFVSDEIKVDSVMTSFDGAGNRFNSAISTNDNKEAVVEEAIIEVDTNIYFGADMSDLCDNEVKSIFGK